MIGLPSLEVYNSLFKITEQNNNFEFYAHTFNEFSFTDLEDELEDILGHSDITAKHLQHELIGPRFIEAYRKLRSEKLSIDGYPVLLMVYAWSPFRDFDNYLRIVVGLDEDDIQLILEQFTSFLLPMKYHLAFIQLTIFQRLFTQSQRRSWRDYTNWTWGH